MNNREIKFRAWDKMKKIMCEVKEIGFVGDGGVQTNHYQGSLSRFEIMQYTGLEDKNGKEIYEGDIYKTEIEGNYPTFVVEFKNGGFTVAGLTSDIEVIGNIYEEGKEAKDDIILVELIRKIYLLLGEYLKLEGGVQD